MANLICVYPECKSTVKHEKHFFCRDHYPLSKKRQGSNEYKSLTPHEGPCLELSEIDLAYEREIMLWKTKETEEKKGKFLCATCAFHFLPELDGEEPQWSFVKSEDKNGKKLFDYHRCDTYLKCQESTKKMKRKQYDEVSTLRNKYSKRDF